MNFLINSDMLHLIAPAFAAGLLVALTHVPLGREVLSRGIIFLDLAVAQIAGLGVILASALFGWTGPMAQIPAFGAAFIAAIIFSKLERYGQTVQEAFIGCAFVLAASVAILVFAGDPHSGEEVSTLLAGQILWAQWPNLLMVSILYIPVVALLVFRPIISRRYFYILFALSITLSVQLVGVYLVFASLILPALASCRMQGDKGLIKGYSVAFIAIVGGLIISVMTDLPSGPLLVCSYALIAALFSILPLKRKTV